MKIKTGPAATASIGQSYIPVIKEEFAQPSILMAPPIVFQVSMQWTEAGNVW